MSSPSPGGGGSARIARCETGWGDGPSTRAPFETIDLHPTPPLISFAIADAKHRRSLETAAGGRLRLPLQGRVRVKRGSINGIGAPLNLAQHAIQRGQTDDDGGGDQG